MKCKHCGGNLDAEFLGLSLELLKCNEHKSRVCQWCCMCQGVPSSDDDRKAAVKTRRQTEKALKVTV